MIGCLSKQSGRYHYVALLGLISPDSGSIRIMGQDVSKSGTVEKQKLGVVLSDSGFSGYLTVKDIPPILSNLYKDFDRAFFSEQVKKLGLPDNKKIKVFSKGMKAKLKILTAISHKAKLLILDEPTAGLDVVARDELLEMLREFMEQDEEHGILISSHISGDLEGLDYLHHCRYDEAYNDADRHDTGSFDAVACGIAVTGCPDSLPPEIRRR